MKKKKDREDFITAGEQHSQNNSWSASSKHVGRIVWCVNREDSICFEGEVENEEMENSRNENGNEKTLERLWSLHE